MLDWTLFLLSFLLLKKPPTYTLFNFSLFSFHFENNHPFPFSDSLHFVILLRKEGLCVRTQ